MSVIMKIRSLFNYQSQKKHSSPQVVFYYEGSMTLTWQYLCCGFKSFRDTYYSNILMTAFGVSREYSMNIVEIPLGKLFYCKSLLNLLQETNEVECYYANKSSVNWSIDLCRRLFGRKSLLFFIFCWINVEFISLKYFILFREIRDKRR